MSAQLTGTAVRVVHAIHCPEIGPICEVRPEPGQQHDPSLARIGGEPSILQLVIVQRDGESPEPGRGGTIHQRAGVVIDQVDGIFCGVEMKVYFQHVPCPALVGFRPVCSTTPAIQQRAFRAK